jgi:signal peptidase I
VFKDPRSGRDFIKRCIGLGGETLRVVDNTVYIDGKPLEEPYKTLKFTGFGVRKDFGPVRIPKGTLFMMGDNRNNSEDSRVWGPLSMDRIVGRAFVLYWSTDPSRAPRWVRAMPESRLKGLLSLFLGRPRLRRLGKWLAHDYTPVYRSGGLGGDPARPAPATS